MSAGLQRERHTDCGAPVGPDLCDEIRCSAPRFLHEALEPIEAVEARIRAFIKPDASEAGPSANLAYHGAKAMKMTGKGFLNTTFIGADDGRVL